jgi:hypothetical protein
LRLWQWLSRHFPEFVPGWFSSRRLLFFLAQYGLFD